MNAIILLCCLFPVLPQVCGILGGLLGGMDILSTGAGLLDQMTGGLGTELMGTAASLIKKALFSNCGDIAKTVRDDSEEYAAELLRNSQYLDDGYFNLKWTTTDTEAMIKKCIGEVTFYYDGMMPCCSGWKSETRYPDRSVKSFEMPPLCDEKSTLVIRYKYKTNERTYGDANGEIRLNLDMKGTPHCPLEDPSAEVKTQSMQVPYLMLAAACFFVLIGLILCAMKQRRGCLFRCFNPCFDGTCLDIGDSEEESEWDEEEDEDLEMGDARSFNKSERKGRDDRYQDDFQDSYDKDDYNNSYDKSY